MYFQEINLQTVEGRLLFAAIAKMTTEGEGVHKTPDEILGEVEELAGKMYDPTIKVGDKVRILPFNTVLHDEYIGEIGTIMSYTKELDKGDERSFPYLIKFGDGLHLGFRTKELQKIY